MVVINKHSSYESQLSAIADSDGTKFELLSMIIDWGLQKIDNLKDDFLFQLEIRENIYVMEIKESVHFENRLMVMFEYFRGTNTLTLLSVRVK